MPQDRWNHASVKASQALAHLPRKANGDVSWGNVRIAHLDTGYRRHAAFGPWAADGSNAIIETPGKDFYRPQRTTAEDPLTQVSVLQEPGHGARTGAVLAGRSADGGFLGIAPGLSITPYRVNDNSILSGRACRAIGRALDDVIAQGRCQVASISLGFPFVLDKEMGEAVDRAYESGIIICCAAGEIIDRVCYPAKHRRCIGVAGYRKNNRIYQRYDRYGRIDAWAPADHITRPDAFTAGAYKDKGDGTSYSTVHVSAAAAIWLRFHGARISQRYGATWQRVEAFRMALRQSQRPLPFKATGLPGNSAGKLDIANLLAVGLPDATHLLREDDLASDDEV